MTIAITSRRFCKLFRMIANLNQFLLFSPVAYENSNIVQNPFLVSLKVRYFCCSRLVSKPHASLSASSQSTSSPFTSQLSRVARTEAQAVLLEYLLQTRSYSFVDAEHISKNSPQFLQRLLSKVGTEKDLKKAFARYLRYNPINEFEPFLESLGLSPSELSPLLPRHLMFLSDDDVMLDNFHVLCGYGIPRIKIGKIYKEATEVFGYNDGVLALKLKAYENLGLSKTSVIKLVTCCPSLLVGGVDDKLVQVLAKFKGLRIKSDSMVGNLSVKSSYDWSRVLDTITFLDKVGYSQQQLGNLLKKNPALVFEGSGKKVYLLFGRLIKLGLKMNELHSLFIQNPQILSARCTKNLFGALDFLLDIGMRTEDIAYIASGHMGLMGACSLKGPKTICRELKVEKKELCHIIKGDPLKFFNLASKTKTKGNGQLASEDPSRFLEKTEFLLRLGYVENSDEMTKALEKFRGRADQLQERFDCLVHAGLDCNVVADIIRRAPMVLNQSKDVIERKIDYLKNCLGYPLESVVAFPAYLCYDMERISRRFLMYVWLRERAAAKSMLSLSTILACSDKRFSKYFVDVHPEGPAIWKSLNKSPTS